MKIYYKAGLLELAKYSGYRGATLKALGLCSNFKRTHQFYYAIMGSTLQRVHAFLQTNGNEMIVRDVKCLLTAAVEQNHTPQQSMERIDAQVSNNSLRKWRGSMIHGHFGLGLYLEIATAIPSNKWKLRSSSLKRMAPLFAVFDRGTYERIILRRSKNIPIKY